MPCQHYELQQQKKKKIGVKQSLAADAAIVKSKVELRVEEVDILQCCLLILRILGVLGFLEYVPSVTIVRMSGQIIKSLHETILYNSLEHDVKPDMDFIQNSGGSVGDKQNFQEREEKILEDKYLVQIQADRKEIYRRISSFVTRKRKAVDEWNVQEFCNHHPVEEDNPLWDNDEFVSCARVDAVFIPRTGSKSHVKVSKVNNVLGPQIQLQNSASVSTKTEVAAEEFSRFESDSIEERLRNMESHLKLKTDSSARNNIYARLKQLEDRILYLESCSPEYLNFLGTKIGSPEKQSKTEEPVFYTSNTARLHKRIQTLREELKSKSRKIASESP